MWAAIAAFLLPLLMRIIVWMLAKFLIRALFSVGLAIVIYKYAAQPLFDQLKGLILTDAGPTILAWIGYLNLDKAITIICSAYVMRLAANAVGIGKKS